MIDGFEKNGVTLNHEVMPNGEQRFRMYFADGSAYIRTESSEDGSWQNSHYHKSICEAYIVQKGCIVFVEQSLDSEVAQFSILKEGEACFAKSLIAHNVFLPRNSVIHTVKYGVIIDKDWNAFEALDKQTKPLSEDELLRLYGR